MIGSPSLFAPLSGNLFVVWVNHTHKIGYSVSTPENIFTEVQTMLTVEQIKKRLQDANLKRVAENAGIHPATVYRFMQEESKPLYETVKALSDYLSRQEATVNG
jgi:predicted urease superfamily metal-dependent hydrolase